MANRLYIGNLTFSATAEEVRSAFQPHGTVTDVRLVMDRETGRSRGFAFVTMGSDEEAERAMKKMDGALLGGRPLRVSEAQDRVARPSGLAGSNSGFKPMPPADPFGMPVEQGFGDGRRRPANARGKGGHRDAPKERRRGERW
jgi:RNA recognition motif-containing protein